MKRLFKNSDEVKGACELLIGQYDEHIKSIDEDKCVLVEVTDEGLKYHVTLKWVASEKDNEADWTDDHFDLLKTDSHRKLESYMEDSLKLVTEYPVVKAHSPINI